MNRETRRKMKSSASANMAVHKIAEFINDIGQNAHDELSDGDKVKLNTKRIIGRKEFGRLQREYQEFVRSNSDTVFTVHITKRSKGGFPVMVELVESPKWLFWSGDLIRVK